MASIASSIQLRSISFVIYATIVVLVSVTPPTTVIAAESTSNDSNVQSTNDEEITIPDSNENPRAVMQYFLNAMEEAKQGDTEALQNAALALDLKDINPLVQIEKGSELAWTLLNVLERGELTSVNRIPDRAQGLPFTVGKFDSGSIDISFTENSGWHFSSKSLSALPSILDELSADEGTDAAATPVESYLPLSVRIRQMMPDNLKAKSFALEHWQWIGILLTILIGFILDKAVSLMLPTYCALMEATRGV